MQPENNTSSEEDTDFNTTLNCKTASESFNIVDDVDECVNNDTRKSRIDGHTLPAAKRSPGGRSGPDYSKSFISYRAPSPGCKTLTLFSFFSDWFKHSTFI